MDFELSGTEQSWRAHAEEVGRSLEAETSPASIVAAAARAGLLDPNVSLLAAAVAVEAVAFERAGAGIAFALHTSVLRAVVGGSQNGQEIEALRLGRTVGALAMTSEEAPLERHGRLNGRASWVVPLTEGGVAVIGGRGGQDRGDGSVTRTAWLVKLDAPGVRATALPAAALKGIVCGELELTDALCVSVGPTLPVMAVGRVLLAAAGLGMGRRAIQESLEAAKAYGRTGAGGEQTVQGLLADAATELDAAKLLTWKAASSSTPSLAEASMAKLAVTEATQHAVAHATQIVGSASFREGHVIERLAQDVRALELFAGRTEALREAVALETIPLADES